MHNALIFDKKLCTKTGYCILSSITAWALERR